MMDDDYYTLSSQGYVHADHGDRPSGNHRHVKTKWTDERRRYVTTDEEEDGSRDQVSVRKLDLKQEEEEEEEEETNDFIITSSSSEKVKSERMIMTSDVKYIKFGALKHDNGGGGGRALLPPPSNRYTRGHPKYYRCRG